MTIFWPAFIGGIVCVVIGIIVLVYRARLADTNADAQRAVFGKIGDRTSKASTSGRMGMTGAGIVVVGLIGVVLSLLDLNW
ncbi:hypothetical protein ACTHQ6_06080 [Arthrobacter sp. SAFR-179]|uniref:hypothetical protein n=1 Tax=Arthrobacter sp. SAFR-179 TaxID=3387279 RepID=UPI003F7BFD91